MELQEASNEAIEENQSTTSPTTYTVGPTPAPTYITNSFQVIPHKALRSFNSEQT